MITKQNNLLMGMYKELKYSYDNLLLENNQTKWDISKLYDMIKTLQPIEKTESPKKWTPVKTNSIINKKK